MVGSLGTGGPGAASSPLIGMTMSRNSKTYPCTSISTHQQVYLALCWPTVPTAPCPVHPILHTVLRSTLVPRLNSGLHGAGGSWAEGRVASAAPTFLSLPHTECRTRGRLRRSQGIPDGIGEREA